MPRRGIPDLRLGAVDREGHTRIHSGLEPSVCDTFCERELQACRLYILLSETTQSLSRIYVQELHPSTKNHYLWDTITKIRNARMERKVSAVFNGHGTASREAVLAMLKVAEGRGSNETQEVQDMTDMLSAYSKLAVKRYIDEVGMALRHEMTSAERIEKMVSALEDYLHGQDSEQLKCLFEPNKLTKKKRDSLVDTVGRLQKAQARMTQGIVARG